MPTAIATKPLTVKGVDLFHVGTQTDSLGRSRSWTKADLLELAETYNSGVGTHDAPVQVGHDGRSMEEDMPGFSHATAPLLIPTGEAAYGWVEKLYVDGNTLKGDLNYVHPDFVEALQRKTYRKRSISIYPRDHSANPHKGKLSLRHVAYVGLPAVKGLQDHSDRYDSRFLNYDFAESDSLTYEFEESSDFGLTAMEMNPITAIGNIFRNLRDQLIASKGVEEADKIYPYHLVQSLETFEMPYVNLDALRAEMSAIANSYNPNYSEAHDFMAGSYLKELMKDKGIDVAAGAEATGIKSDRLQALMSDEAEPSTAEAEKLASALGVSADRFKGKTSKEKTTDMSEENPAVDYSELQAQIAALRAENDSIKAERERDRITNFVESMASQQHRKLLPADKAARIELLLAMPNDNTVNFSENGKEVSKTPRQVMMDAIASGQPLWGDSDMPTSPADAPSAFSEVPAHLDGFDPASVQADRQLRQFCSEYNEKYSAKLNPDEDYSEALETYSRVTGVTF